MEISRRDFYFWGMVEQDLSIKIPDHIKNNFNACGYNNPLIFKNINDEDIAYVESYVRENIPALIELNFKDTDSFDPDKHGSCFFGTYSKKIKSFEFSLNEKWLVKQIIDYLNKFEASMSHFNFSPFESKLNVPVERIAFFKSSTENECDDQNFPLMKTFIKPILLNGLVCEAKKNENRNKHGYRFNEDVKEASAYLRMVSGKLAFETLQSNFLSALPSVSTVNRFINKANGQVTECVLRVNELLDYLNSRNLPLVVSLSEDATRISGRVQYDSRSNQIIGFVAPIDKETGMPLTGHYPARNAEEIFCHFNRSNPAANFVNVIMAQPLYDVPAFCLLVYGSDSKYTAEDVINRWQNISRRLREVGIIVLSIASDSDPKFNSAMRKSCMLGAESKMIAANWFKCGVENLPMQGKPIFIQDTPHIGTKLRNALLKTFTNRDLYPFGDKYFIRLDHVKFIMENFQKDEHELVPQVFSTNDRQNFDSVMRMCSSKVTRMMKTHVKDSEGTVAILNIIRDIIDAYKDPGLDPLERLDKIWYAVFVIRIWREYILSKEGLTLKNNFLNMNCYSCIEINAHSLLLLVLHLRDSNQSNLFLTHLLDSQPCEQFFRQIRSFTSVYSTVANCSVKEILGRISKIQLQSDIAHKSELNFPRVKRVNLHKKTMSDLPKKEAILDQIEKCKRRAIKFAIQIKLLDKASSIPFDFECKVPLLTPKPAFEEDINESEHETTIGSNDLRKIHLKNFVQKYHGLEIPENSSVVRVIWKDNKEYVVKKTSLCWLLRPAYSKLSSDRVIRVKMPCNQNIKKK